MPFDLQHKMIVNNVTTKKTMTIDHVVVNDLPFFKLIKRGPLASVLNQRFGGRAFPGVTMFTYLQDLRDNEVSKIIKREIISSDHFCDNENDDDIDITSYNKRAEAFSKHVTQDIIELSIPGFESHKAKHGPIVIKVLTTHKMKSPVWLHATPANFDWLEVASTHKWVDANHAPAAEPQRSLNMDGVEVATLKKVKIKECGERCCVLVINYKKSKDKWTRKQVRVSAQAYSSNSDYLEAVRRSVENLEEFFENNHHSDGSEDDDDESGEGADE